jgi:DNA-binding GntR family transcriptional regulator
MRALLGRFDPMEFSALNRNLHFTIYERCPNRHVRTLLEGEWARLDRIRRSTFVYVPGRARSSVDEHDALLTMLESGADADKVEQAARAHKLHTIEALLAASKSAGRVPDSRSTARR